jgi:hypothetical protein
MLRTLFVAPIPAGALAGKCDGAGAGCGLCVAFETQGLILIFTRPKR